MTPRRIIDQTFMALFLVAGLAGAAQAATHPEFAVPARPALTQEATDPTQDCAAIRRVPRGDDARQRTRETVQSARRGGVATA